ncbi:MAG: hypothetical protein GY730_05300 [bacterium]|nr:hypothetical protein [bacterium]
MSILFSGHFVFIGQQCITTNEYDKKAKELKDGQTRINIQLQQHAIADEEYGTTLTTLMDLASRAYELFEKSKVDQKRKLINFVLSNLELKDGKLTFEVKQPFAGILKVINSSSWLG